MWAGNRPLNPNGFGADVLRQLPEDSMFRKIYVYECLASTNDTAGEMAAAGAAAGTVVIAGRQTAGRGRRGRIWVSPAGENIYMSFILRPDLRSEAAPMVTLVCALAVREALAAQGLEALIKWPNDIILSGRKVCGILTEMRAEGEQILYIVCGIGINVRQRRFPPEIAGAATSMVVEREADYSCSRIAASVLAAFEKYFGRLIARGDLRELRELYDRYLVNRDREVIIEDGARADASGGSAAQTAGEERAESAQAGDNCVRVSGIARGIDDKGRLLVETDGQILRVLSGEVSVRGVLGYV